MRANDSSVVQGEPMVMEVVQYSTGIHTPLISHVVIKERTSIFLLSIYLYSFSNSFEVIGIFFKKHVEHNDLKNIIFMHCFWPEGNVRMSHSRYLLCCARETSENSRPWALAPETKFFLIFLPSFTRGQLS